MIPDHLTSSQADELLERQGRLQAEAEALLQALDLPALLGRTGEAVGVGSSMLGLMAWRDIDFNVLCDPNTGARAFAAVQPLAGHPLVHKLRFSNESGRFNSTSKPVDEGYYWGVRAVTEAGDQWKLDVWFLPAAVPRPEIALLRSLPPRLTPETRLAILWLKDIWHRQPSYRGTVLSIDIYDAVMEHGVRTPAEFDVYLHQRGKPTWKRLDMI